tara:strand:- start:221 stop:463 length:243 start_codon:yes stop_codon:yes gene_type:complete
MKPITKDAMEKLYDETGIYQWHTTDRKVDKPSMGVDIIFAPYTDVEKAIDEINKVLENSGLSYKMDTWTLPHQDNFMGDE